jgi:2-polyprenyl-6-methoxyphenol hydroxylase-like FAD-dependent oxidoreductase
MTTIGKNAVVIGAGMSGLPTAKVLAEYFETVTIVERDVLPANAEARPGTPQARLPHVLLGGGQRALNELFPNLTQDLIDAGGVEYRLDVDMLVERAGHDALPRRDLGWTGISLSRPLIESVVRRRTLQHPRITLKSGRRAAEIVALADGTKVTAVRCETINGAQEMVPAELVVDASGRGSLLLALLRAVGSPLPAETVIGINRSYASAVVPKPDHAPDDWKNLRTMPDPSLGGRGGGVLTMEGNRWMITVSGQDGSEPPRDWGELLQSLQKLRTRTVFDTVRNAIPARQIARFILPESVWRHFEQLDAMPRGVLPIGDAFCRFNPIYGQGMTVAAQEACLLRDVLRRAAQAKDPLMAAQQAFLGEVSPLIEGPWVMSAVNDFKFPGTRGERPADFDKATKYGAAMQRLAVHDPAIHKLIFEVQHLLKPRSAFRHPDIVRLVTAEIEAA